MRSASLGARRRSRAAYETSDRMAIECGRASDGMGRGEDSRTAHRPCMHGELSTARARRVRVDCVPGISTKRRKHRLRGRARMSPMPHTAHLDVIVFEALPRPQVQRSRVNRVGDQVVPSCAPSFV